MVLEFQTLCDELRGTTKQERFSRHAKCGVMLARRIFVAPLLVAVLMIFGAGVAEARCSQATYDAYLDQIQKAVPAKFGADGPVAKDLADDLVDKAKWCATTAYKAHDTQGYWEARSVYALAGALWAAGAAANGEFADSRRAVKEVIVIANQLQRSIPGPGGMGIAHRLRDLVDKVDAIAHEGQRQASIH